MELLIKEEMKTSGCYSRGRAGEGGGRGGAGQPVHLRLQRLQSGSVLGTGQTVRPALCFWPCHLRLSLFSDGLEGGSAYGLSAALALLFLRVEEAPQLL